MTYVPQKPGGRTTLRRCAASAHDVWHAGQQPFDEHDVVHLLVGEFPFTMWRKTIMNYPNSLLAELLTKLYPNRGVYRCPIIIDRDKKTFWWIREIYRHGDIENSMLYLSREDLQRDLDFYRLPSLEDLGLSSVPPASSLTKANAAKALMQEIVNEIVETGIEKLFPWSVFIYHESTENQRTPQRRVFVCPDCLDGTALAECSNPATNRRHPLLNEARSGDTEVFDYDEQVDRLSVVSKDRKRAIVVQLATAEMVDFIKEKAQGLGLLAESEWKKFCFAHSPKTYPILHLRWLNDSGS